jgi:hypothetical protein
VASRADIAENKNEDVEWNDDVTPSNCSELTPFAKEAETNKKEPGQGFKMRKK